MRLDKPSIEFADRLFFALVRALSSRARNSSAQLRVGSSVAMHVVSRGIWLYTQRRDPFAVAGCRAYAIFPQLFPAAGTRSFASSINLRESPTSLRTDCLRGGRGFFYNERSVNRNMPVTFETQM